MFLIVEFKDAGLGDTGLRIEIPTESKFNQMLEEAAYFCPSVETRLDMMLFSARTAMEQAHLLAMCLAVDLLKREGIAFDPNAGVYLELRYTLKRGRRTRTVGHKILRNGDPGFLPKVMATYNASHFTDYTCFA